MPDGCAAAPAVTAAGVALAALVATAPLAALCPIAEHEEAAETVEGGTAVVAGPRGLIAGVVSTGLTVGVTVVSPAAASTSVPGFFPVIL